MRQYKILLSPEHQYSIMDLRNGRQIQTRYPIISVSTISQKMCHEFNPLSAIQRLSEEKRRIEYNNADDATILNIWKCNERYCANLGIKMHSVLQGYMENLRQGIDVFPEIPFPLQSEVKTFDDSGGVIILSIHLEQIREHFKEKKWVHVEIELPVFSLELLVAGTLDIIVCDSNGDYILIDWKRTKRFR